MGIYIKGMEMPKSCRDCLLCAGQANMDYGVCTWCRVDGKARDAHARQDCPLVPVPQHGRCIDVDVLLNKLQALYDERECEARYTGSKEIKVSWNEAVYQIINAPTIIQADECIPSYEKKISMTEYEQALHDLYVALRFSEWKDNKPYLYEINGTAEVIADAVCALVEKRSKRN